MVETRILVIDDSVQMTRLIARFLQDEGFLVITLSDPREAVETFVDFQPHLVILDLNMPYLSGWQVCRMLKDIQSVPVIIFSVRDDEEDIDRGFQAGADDYLIKPFEFPDLLQRIERLLGEQGPA